MGAVSHGLCIFGGIARYFRTICSSVGGCSRGVRIVGLRGATRKSILLLAGSGGLLLTKMSRGKRMAVGVLFSSQSRVGGRSCALGRRILYRARRCVD